MVSASAVDRMLRDQTNQLFFGYVQEQLLPKLISDGHTELAGKIEGFSQPLTVSGLERKILRNLKYFLLLPFFSELEDRKNYFLRQIISLPTKEKDVINRYVSDALTGLPYLPKFRLYQFADIPEEYRKAVALSAIKAASS